MPRCPVCYVPMTRTEEEGLRGHACPSCFGHWMPAVAMLRRFRADVQQIAVKTAELVPAAQVVEVASSDGAPVAVAEPAVSTVPEQSPLEDLVEIVAASDSKGPLRCPDCEKVMRKDRYQQMIPVMVDRCKACDRVWLDTGELHLLRRLYVELGTSTDPEVVRLREKMAVVSMDWHTRPVLGQVQGQPTAEVAGPTMEIADLSQLVFRLLVRH